MTAPFTPEQEARLVEMMTAVLEMAVAAGVGDIPRLITRLDFLLIANPSVDRLPRDRLLHLSNQTLDEANATVGLHTQFGEAGECR